MTLALYLLAGFGFSVIGLFLSLMFTVSIRKAWLKILLVTIISLVFGFGCATITGIVTTEHEKTWNGGYCSCCGEWDFECIVKTRHGMKTYVYECNECGKIFETTTKFE
jgi:hypothetical protein